MGAQGFPRTAFILGAGLGTRLRPLTDVLPKPLIPVGQSPLIRHAFAHCAAAGVERFIVNTHHLAARYEEFFPQPEFEGRPIRFIHEPEVLETAGGLWNIAPALEAWQEDGPVLVYNGDVLSTLDLGELWATHQRSGAEVTLGLLPSGGPIQVNFDSSVGHIRDFGARLLPDSPSNALFTGIYIVEPAFRARLVPGLKESVVPVWVRMIQEGAIVAGAWLGGGHWRDLGRREEYLRVVRELHEAPGDWAALANESLVSPEAQINREARLLGACQIGAGARLGAGAVLEECIVWPGAEIAPGAHLRHCIVTGRSLISGDYSGVDI